MYSTKLMNRRYEIECISLTRVLKIQRFIVDTGAMYTCCHYSINGSAVKFYEYPLKQFTIGNINRGTCNIWITFDKRVVDMVLGLDLLKDMVFLNRPSDGTLCFFESEKQCREYMQTHY